MMQLKSLIGAIAALVLSASIAAEPLGTAFNYQGQLQQGGTPVTDACDFAFGLWDSESAGTEVAVSVDALNVDVNEGSFNLDLDFGPGVFDGDRRWLEIAVVCPAGSGGYTTLAPRQELTANPHSTYAITAGSVDWSGLTNVPPGLADGDDVDDDDNDATNELQDLSLSTNTLSLTDDATPVDLSAYLEDADADPTNELQDLSLSSNILSLTDDATPVDLSAYLEDADADPTNELQDLSLSINTLSLSEDATTVDLSAYLEDADADPTNELQDLSLSGNTLSLSEDATPVDLSGYLDNTDDQTLGEILRMSLDAEGEDIRGVGLMTVGTVAIRTEPSDFQLESVLVENGATGYPLKLTNRGSDLGSSAGILFQAGVNIPDQPLGKGAIAYQLEDTWNRGSFMFLQNSAGDSSMAQTADAVMTIKNDGRIGIGTTMPTAMLESAINGEGWHALKVTKNSQFIGTAAGVVFQSGENYEGSPLAKGAIAYRHDDTFNRGSFIFLQNSAENSTSVGLNDVVMTIENDGRVGIDTWSPLAKLETVESQPGALSYPLMISNPDDSAGTAVGLLFNVESVVDIQGIKGAIVYERTDSHNRGDFHFLQNPESNWNLAGLDDSVLTIRNNGRIGIGTTAPVTHFDLRSASTNITGFNIKNNTSDQRFLLQVNGTDPGDAFRVGNFEIWASGSSGNHNVYTAKANGDVGIRNQNPQHPLQIGTTPLDGNQAHLTDGGVWTNGSDRESKQGFELIDKQAILEKLADLEVSQWQYKGEEESIRHIGPVAQDFYATFGLGGSDRHIGTVDADGVALAAIQGLLELTKIKDTEIDALRNESARLKARLVSLETAFAKLNLDWQHR
jgi:hypothetical protein